MSSTSLWSRSQKSFALCLAIVFAVFLAGCESPKKTVTTLRAEIKEFQTSADPNLPVEIERNFAKLEQQVADLKAKNSDEATDYQIHLSALRADYQTAKFNKAIAEGAKTLQNIGNALEESAKSIKEAFKSGTNK